MLGEGAGGEGAVTAVAPIQDITGDSALAAWTEPISGLTSHGRRSGHAGNGIPAALGGAAVGRVSRPDTAISSQHKLRGLDPPHATVVAIGNRQPLEAR